MSSSHPFFSVIIPTYNRAQAVVKAVESVLAQTYTNFEVIVVDDGSTDDTSVVIKALSEQDDRVVYLFQENQERSAARNNGIAQSNGKYVCFLDSDDTYERGHLAELEKTIITESNAVALYHVHGELRNAEKATPITFPKHIKGENKLEYVLFKAVIPTSFVCISREILTKHEFNTDLHVGEDRELWSRIVAEYPIILSAQQTVVQNDLGDRTVDIANLKTAKENLRTTQLILSQNGAKLSGNLHRRMLSAAYFKMARSYLANQQRTKAVLYTLRAVLLHQDKYTPSLLVFTLQAAGLDFLLPARFKKV